MTAHWNLENMSQQNKKSKWSPVLLILGLILCIAAGLIGWLLYRVPLEAEEIFGKPGTNLGTMQRYTYSVQLLLNVNNLLEPLNSAASQVAFRVPDGATASEVAYTLEAEGLIRSADAFRAYLVYTGLDTGLQSGSYQLSPSMTAVDIAHELLDATPTEVTFNILPGWRAEEIAAALPTSGLAINSEQFMGAVTYPTQTMPEGMTSLEGLLAPGSYQIKRDASVQDLLSTFLDRFNQNITPEIRQGFEKQGLTFAQGVILASIVQREAMVEDEQPTIASVFLNRLHDGSKLDSDPTVQYAIGYNQEQKTWWTNPLSAKDLTFDSPYNTYLYGGLPPAPISNPGVSALKAVAFPAETPYYYFRAACDQSGRHVFAETYEEHLANACP